MNRSTLTALLFIPFILALYVTLNKVFIPLALKAATSDLFLEETDDIGDMDPISNAKTKMASLHCNNEVSKEMGESLALQFPPDPKNVWDTGNATFVVSSYVDVTNPAEGTTRKLYACNIRYEGGDDTDFKNWTLLGLQF